MQLFTLLVLVQSQSRRQSLFKGQQVPTRAPLQAALQLLPWSVAPSLLLHLPCMLAATATGVAHVVFTGSACNSNSEIWVDNPGACIRLI